MKYKSILSAVGVIVAVMLTGCDENNGTGPNNPDNPDIPNTGGGRGGNIGNYKTVVIGTQRWMAENLDNAIDGSVCHGNLSSNCEKYGRLYTWEIANRACPSGWHLPSDDEWSTLVDYVGGASTAGRKLKSTSGWYISLVSGDGNGTDEYGFSALPGGTGFMSGNYDGNGGYDGNAVYDGNTNFSGAWWSATASYNVNDAWGRRMNNLDEIVNRFYTGKSNLFSVRCVADQ